MIEERDDGTVVLERRGSARVMSLCAALAAIATMAIPVYLGVRDHDYAAAVLFSLLWWCVAVPVAVGCLYCAGPLKLVIDRRGAAYTVVRGFPWRVRTVTGPLSDIAPLRVTKTAGFKGGPPSYHVTLTWTVPGRPRLPLTEMNYDPEFVSGQAKYWAGRLGLSADAETVAAARDSG